MNTIKGVKYHDEKLGVHGLGKRGRRVDRYKQKGEEGQRLQKLPKLGVNV